MNSTEARNCREAPYGTVSSIERQRRRGRVNVYVDGSFALGLSEIVAVRDGLRPGVVISKMDVERLQDEDATQVALDSSLGFLSYRPRSEREIRRNLKRRDLSDNLIDRVVKKLSNLGLLDDKAFARFWIAQRDQHSPRGEYALRSELRAKGVSREDADEAIRAGDEEETRARAIVLRRMSRLRDEDPVQLRKRLIEAVVRRGFSYDIAYRTVREVLGGTTQGDDDRDQHEAQPND